MSDHLLQFFLADSPTKTTEDEPNLLWKVVLRTGTWKLRPGPGGVKLHQPLKIYRDQAPKGHISMADIVKSFKGDEKGPAKENVTLTQVHADGTTSDGGFVRKLAIQDVNGEDGSGAKESLLWAGLEVTDSDLKKKLDEKSIVGCSGGILFDYERTEDAKKFPQILSHVMATNSPWINGTGGYHDKLPEGVMASEPDDLPMGELELDTPAVEEPPESVQGNKSQPATGDVVWKPTDGFAWIKGKIQRALEDRRREVMAALGDQRYSVDYPYYSVDDIQGDGAAGKALICSGYGSDKESWVAGYTFNEGVVEIDAFVNWTPARPEWVAASEAIPAPSAAPTIASSVGAPSSSGTTVFHDESELRRAQRRRQERLGFGQTAATTEGGTRMGRLMDALQGIELSEEQREAIRREEEQAERDRREAEAAREKSRREEVNTFLSSLKDTPFDTPGVKKYIQGVFLSDDGGPAVEYVELSDDGQRTQPKGMTATEVIKGLFDRLPKDAEGKLSLSSQAARLPGDEKPPEGDEGDKDKRPPAEKGDALLAELESQGLEFSGVASSGKNGGS